MIGALLVFAAFVLLLLVSLSTPIAKSIDLFSLHATVASSVLGSGIRAVATFGVWGYCTSRTERYSFEFDLYTFCIDSRKSVVGVQRTSGRKCTKPHLGYDFSNDVASIFDLENDQSAINHAITAALVLHPIACALAFLALLFALARLRSPAHRLLHVAALVLAVLAALLATVVFLIDVIFVALARSKLKTVSHGDLIVSYGNAVWMALGAAIALWVASVAICAGLCGCHRPRKSARY
ncbi:hypothetical protein SISSUDRAFT_327198 [Sistotremastrum suecicum HHB10207 ss-3]|uniref:Pali-domain-containing protein n=1 Tax=Sistotremastrum suecicum HHB10207 ss-3 TaxID=1314776 RepID=A0A166ITB1_9AGAM|nr:hypothetical protein SISSUDRAFT_327198 [Sistotremastrum suecicum HHB10207 ss-3]